MWISLRDGLRFMLRLWAHVATMTGAGGFSGYEVTGPKKVVGIAKRKGPRAEPWGTPSQEEMESRLQSYAI